MMEEWKLYKAVSAFSLSNWYWASRGIKGLGMESTIHVDGLVLYVAIIEVDEGEV
jgi:hypothetical protein